MGVDHKVDCFLCDPNLFRRRERIIATLKPDRVVRHQEKGSMIVFVAASAAFAASAHFDSKSLA